MSGVFNHNWYAANAVRNYPLDDAATGISDDSLRLPSDVLADLRLRWPRTLGQAAALSSVTLTPRLVSVTIVALRQPVEHSELEAAVTGDEPFVPLAALALRRPITPYRAYALEPLSEGVGGWIVFGDGVGNLGTYRFSTGRQGLINYRSARFYRELPIPSVGRQNHQTELQGAIALLGGADVEVIEATRTIQEESRRVIVVRLAETQRRNLLDLYRGPCSGRPESGTCLRPGIEFLDNIGPDCNGNINITFPTPVEVTPYAGGGGIAIDYPVGLTEACTRDDRLPDSEGKLPNEYEDLCASSSLGDPDANAGFAEPIPIAPINVSSEVVDEAVLPYVEDFSDAIANRFQSIVNSISIDLTDATSVGGSPYVFRPDDASVRSVALWYDPVWDGSYDRELSCDVWFDNQSPRQTGGLILNYRPSTTIDSDEYFTVELDRDRARMIIRRWDGLSFTTLATANGIRFSTGIAYRITAQVSPGSQAGLVYIYASVAPALIGIPLGEVAVESARYLPDTGKPGLGADRSNPAFLRFSVEEV